MLRRLGRKVKVGIKMRKWDDREKRDSNREEFNHNLKKSALQKRIRIMSQSATTAHFQKVRTGPQFRARKGISDICPMPFRASYKIKSKQKLVLQKKIEIKLGTYNLETEFDFNWDTNRYLKHLISSEPVYIDDSEGKEQLVYHSKKMKTGKLYKVTWENNKVALRKNSNGKVEFLEFIKDKK